MPYVLRTAEGTITGLFAIRQPGSAEEYLPDDDPDVVAFLAPRPQPEPVDALFANPAVAALIDAINDGSLPVGQSLPRNELVGKIREKLSQA